VDVLRRITLEATMLALDGYQGKRVMISQLYDMRVEETVEGKWLHENSSSFHISYYTASRMFLQTRFSMEMFHDP
jgi:hypothetical protein